MTEPAGRLENGGHILAVRVYYEDTDFSGLVYHANYLKFCERGRSDFLRLRGIHHRELAAAGLAFAVRRMVCDFLKPARIDDLLTVETHPGSFTGARGVMLQRVLNEGTLLFEAEVTVVLLGHQGRPKRWPPDLAAKLTRAGPSPHSAR